MVRESKESLNPIERWGALDLVGVAPGAALGLGGGGGIHAAATCSRKKEITTLLMHYLKPFPKTANKTVYLLGWRLVPESLGRLCIGLQ